MLPSRRKSLLSSFDFLGSRDYRKHAPNSISSSDCSNPLHNNTTCTDSNDNSINYGIEEILFPPQVGEDNSAMPWLSTQNNILNNTSYNNSSATHFFSSDDDHLTQPEIDFKMRPESIEKEEVNTENKPKVTKNSNLNKNNKPISSSVDFLYYVKSSSRNPSTPYPNFIDRRKDVQLTGVNDFDRNSLSDELFGEYKINWLIDYSSLLYMMITSLVRYSLWFVLGFWRILLILSGTDSIIKCRDESYTYEKWYASTRKVDERNGYKRWAHPSNEEYNNYFDYEGLLRTILDVKKLQADASLAASAIASASVCASNCTKGTPSFLSTSKLFGDELTPWIQSEQLQQQLFSVVPSSQSKAEKKTKMQQRSILLRQYQVKLRLQDSFIIDQVKVLRRTMLRNAFGIVNHALYTKYATGTKDIIHNYIDVTCQVFELAGRDTYSDPMEKIRLLVECARLYGQTALILNGGFTLGLYHIGVVKGLISTNTLPRVVFGNNTGAIVAAAICCFKDPSFFLNGKNINFKAFECSDDFDAKPNRGKVDVKKKKESLNGFDFDEKEKSEDKSTSKNNDFNNGILNNLNYLFSLQHKINLLKKEGKLVNVKLLYQFIHDNLGDITFSEAYNATGRVLNIQVDCPANDGTIFLLNYLTTPTVIISSAAAASCRYSNFYSTFGLLCKCQNGDIVPFDIPSFTFSPKIGTNKVVKGLNGAIERMRQLFNVSQFIISECTLLRSPFLRLGHRKGIAWQAIHFLTEEFWRLFCGFNENILRIASKGTLLELVQPYPVPNIVINPVSSLRSLNVCFMNFDEKLMEYCETVGLLSLWPKMEQMKAHMRIENCINVAINMTLERHPELKDISDDMHNSCFF